MEFLKKAFRWVLTQFKKHTIRSLLVTISVAVITVAGILWASGIFSSAPDFSDLPDREYVLAPAEEPDPQTLEELLHSDLPSVDTLLKNPKIAGELMQAEKLIDIVDSRLALNNLRSLHQQLTERLEEEAPQVIDISDATIVRGMLTSAQTSTAQSTEQSNEAAQSSGNGSSGTSYAGNTPLVVSIQFAENYRKELEVLKSATEALLAPPSTGDLVKFPAAMNMKGVWQSPDEVLIHIVPSGDWLPGEGCKLYRVINGQKELIAERIASSVPGLSGELKVDKAKMIQQLYIQAELTPDKLSELGMSAEEFRDVAYRTYSLVPKPRIDGELDFLKMKEALITIPAGIEQRIPETDLMSSQPITIYGKLLNGYSAAAARSSVWKKFSVTQAELPTGIDDLKLLPDGNSKYSLAEKILAARQQLSTLAFVDDEFAKAAGFLISDDLSGLDLPDGAEISYIVETPTRADSTLRVIRGVENNLTKPQRLMGYGVDGKVPLRWAEAETEQERSILSGYHIERKLDGESDFTRITDEPVAISYMLDETNNYFQSPVFYEDTVENGRTAEYRIYSIDIFGRRSEYSDVCSLRVEKVTPPNAPAAESPELIHAGKRGRPSPSDGTADIDADGQLSSAAIIARELNPNMRGIALPVFTDSPDTVRFTIYRAAAVGARAFGPPEAIASLEYDNPEAAALPASESTEPILSEMYQSTATRTGFFKRIKHAQLRTYTPSHPDLIYFDADIEEGCTYKYWVSAWDSWNNESAWSQAVSIAVPTDAEPQDPGELFISMHPRILADCSFDPPGILHNGVITYDELSKVPDLPARPVPEGAVIETVRNAIADGVTIGSFLQNAGTGSSVTNASYCPPVIDIGYNNLPQERYIHVILGVRGDDVFPDGTARLRWPAYSGEGLGGYVVYRPLFEARPLEEMQQMSRSELLAMGRWERMNESPLTQNQLVISGMDPLPGSLTVFLICLEPESAVDSEQIGIVTQFAGSPGVGPEGFGIVSQFLNAPEGGYVYVDWDVPADPQVEFYRVYRSEVPSFKEPVDEASLEWTLVGDRLKNPKYTERVDQSFAHYYYYKVTSVSPWGVESAVGKVQRFRVPSTKPPQTPNLLLPLQTKDGVKVQFSAVSHCDRYEIYRAAIPRLGQEDINEMLATDQELHAALFSSPSQDDIYLTNLLKFSLISDYSANSGLAGTSEPSASAQPGSAASPGSPAQNSLGLSQAASINPISRLKTLTNFNASLVRSNLAALDDSKLLAAYNRILDKYGPLALADYKDLSISMMKRVNWVKVGELPADYDTTEEAGALGLLEPLSFTDTTAMYGITYLYTVQAWNDDNLGSSRPEPVKASPRRNRAFDPIDGLEGEINESQKPSLKWNLPKMYPLTPEQCLEDTVGYIVYRSDTENGTYYQASPLLFDNRWVDESADLNAFNWYKVKVLDTGGYLSEFSDPILVRQSIFVPSVVTVIPELATPEISIEQDETPITEEGEVVQVTSEPAGAAPEITFNGSSFKSAEGEVFETVYKLTGTEPITVTLKATTTDGIPAGGFSVDEVRRKVSAGSGLKAGTYRITVTAKNSAGEDSATFTLTVSGKPVGYAPEIFFDGSGFTSAEGEEFTTVYELSGTEPISVTIQATNAGDGLPAAGFSVDQGARLVRAGPDLKSGTYNVTVTAMNTAGQSSASFTLTVQAKAVPPKLASRKDNYSFRMTAGSGDFTVQLSATGTEPFSWLLKSSSSRINTLPAEASINETGLLTVREGISAGSYSFIVQVSNDSGSDERVISLNVAPRLIPFEPISPLEPIDPTFAPVSPKPTIGPKPSGMTGTGITLLSSQLVAQPTPSSSQSQWQASTQQPTPSLGQSPAQSSSQPVSAAYDFETDRMKCMGFFLSNVRLNITPYSNRYYGTAMMDIGYGTPVNVWIKNAEFEDGGGYANDLLRKGNVYLAEPVELSQIGLTLVSLDVSPEHNRAQISGYIKSTIEGQNLAGDLYVFEFEDAKLEPGKIVASEGLPQIRYKQFVFRSLSHITIYLGALQDENKKLLSMSGNGVFTKSHLETLNNEGLQFEQSIMSFDLHGNMDAAFVTTKEQCLQMLVPGGAALRVEAAALQFKNGQVKPGGRLRGKLVLPFEKASAGGSLVPAVYAGGHPAHNEMDDFASGSGELTEGEMVVMGDILVHYGETVQQNSLLILPASFELQDKCASVPIDVRNWGGEGFVVESSTMDPVRVTNRNVEGGISQDGYYVYTQRAQAVVVSPTTVSVDLDRAAFLQGQDGSQSQNGSEEILTPKETAMPFWVGIVINGGKLALPSAYLQQKDGRTIEFALAEGEMIYDLNGFNYQTYLYSSDPDGVPARFGDNLGGFEEVRIKDCLLDMYANRVNFEINAIVRVDLFHHEWIEAKLFTDEKGKFICSAAPTIIENGLAKNVDMRIDGGFFEPEGLKISGKLVLPPPGTEDFEIGSTDPLAFSDMFIPSDLEKIRGQDGTNIYANVTLDKPVTINFEGFPMEVRGFDIRYTAPKPQILARDAHKPDWAVLTLHGATQLSDTIALSDESTDSLVIKCADKRDAPSVIHADSVSVLKNSFDGCIDIAGILRPKKVQGEGSGLVEFETDKLTLNFLGQSLKDLPVTHYTRFGKAGDEFYFVVGLSPLDSKPISLGGGNIDKFTGLVAQNMVVGKDAEGKLTFPDDAGSMGAYVRNLRVGGGKFAGGIKGEMNVIKLCTIKNLYFGFEPGPKFTVDGDVYVPLDIRSLVTGNPSRHVGEADLQYRHSDRYFSFNKTFERMNIVIFDFGGSMGFEYSPRLFGVRIGYPETLFTNFQLGPIPVRVGAGLGFLIDQDNESMVQAKLEFGLEKRIDIAIVYLHGYIYAGADGAYYWGDPDGSRILLDLYLKGGINGGIRAFGEEFDIISFYLDAHGTLASGAGFRTWELGCSCTVSYSLDLWLAEIEGSVNASFDTTIG